MQNSHKSPIFAAKQSMKIVIQRVTNASVSIDGEVKSAIGKGLLVLLGVAADDTKEDANWLIHKLVALRIFDDSEGIMNLSLTDIGGQVLVVSQFTLMASTKKGNRPSWFGAATHDISIPLYNYFCQQLSATMGHPCATGTFGANMQVALTNDGPVTIIIDTHHKE